MQVTSDNQMKFFPYSDESDKPESIEGSPQVIEDAVPQELFREVEKGNQIADSIKKSIRIFLLLSASLSNVCYFTHTTTTNTLQAQIQQKLAISETQYGLITTCLAIPSVIVPLFLGALIDRLGSRISLLLGSLILVIGDIITFIGAINANLNVVLAGQLIFGLGTDSMVISKVKIMQKWFKGKDFALATGLSVVLIAVCIIAVSSLSPVLFNINNSLFLPFFVELLFGAFSFGMSALAALIDKKNDNAFEKFHVSEKIEKFSFSALRAMPKLFWYVCMSGVLSYGTYSLMNLISSKFIQVRFGMLDSQSGYLRAIPQLGVLAIPIWLGWLLDRYGKRIHAFTFGVTALMIAFILNATLPNCSGCYTVVAPFILEGIYIGVFGVTFYPMIGLVVKTENVGLAMGTFTWFIGIFGAILSPIDGAIIDATKEGEMHGYSAVFWFLLCFQVICMGLLLLAVKKDLRTGKILTRGAKDF